MVSGNLANVSTTGFKEHRIRFEVADIDGQEHSDQFVHTGMAGAKMDDGPIVNDGVDTHLALRGRGFFGAETESGETILVRSGAFEYVPLFSGASGQVSSQHPLGHRPPSFRCFPQRFPFFSQLCRLW